MNYILLVLIYGFLPLINLNTNYYILLLLLINPLACFVLSYFNAKKKGFTFVFPLIASFLFVPFTFIFYNTLCLIFPVFYFLVLYIGTFLGNRKRLSIKKFA